MDTGVSHPRSKAVRAALRIYLCALPLTGFYILGEWLRLYVVAALLLLLVVAGALVFRTELPVASYQLMPEDLLLALLLGAMGLAALINLSPKSLNYLAGYGFVFLCLYMLVKLAVALSQEGLTSIYALLGAVAVAAAVLGVLQFSLKLTTGVDLLSYIPLPKMAIVEATYAGLPRAASTVIEPGYFAMFLQAIGPIGVYGLWRKTRNRVVTTGATGIVLAGWVLAFSAGGAVASAGAAAGVLVVSLIRRHRPIALRLSIGLAILFVAGAVLATIYGDYVMVLVRKIQTGGGARPTGWLEGLHTVADHPLVGTGPGSTTTGRSVSYWSWYLTLTAEVGIAGLLAPLFLAVKGCRAAMLKRPEWPLLLFGLLATAAHLSVVSTFMYGFIWLTVALIDVAAARRRVPAGGLA